MSVILGFDPGSLFTGWGVICEPESKQLGFATGHRTSEFVCLGAGVIQLPAKKVFSERLGQLLIELEEIFARYKPAAIAVEKVFLAKNVDSAFKLGHARGLILAQAGRQQIPVYEYATRYVKKVLTGSGAASKEQVQFWVQKLVNVKESRLDATDALALAICHGRECQVQEKFRQQVQAEGNI